MKPSQKNKVLAHLKMYGEITTMEAFEKYKITRLSELIRLLRKEHTIVTVMVRRKGENPYGRYILKDE